ncbi:MAG: hypothetical protein RKO66_10955 [Candidatus Contendobacter sp.]|nr:hypothetical protein [Candidatus Contendobacter sp.]MDS4057911.1 hypothetical protein [Candidatus Contendobacter sp.]
MNRPAQATALADLQTIRAFAVLTLDGRKWLLPQAEIQALESLLDIDREVRIPCSIGAVAFADEWWPVYCLSGELRILSDLPDGRRACPLLDNGADRFGLVCDQVEALTAAPRLLAPPACMTPPDSPIGALALLNDELGYVTTTEHLAALIAAALENFDG